MKILWHQQRPANWEEGMKKLMLAAIFAAIAAAPALAAEGTYIVRDVTGNCDVVLSSGEDLPGMKVISKAYSSEESARQAAGARADCKDSAKPY
jgi:hypothetical protein